MKNSWLLAGILVLLGSGLLVLGATCVVDFNQIAASGGQVDAFPAHLMPYLHLAEWQASLRSGTLPGQAPPALLAEGISYGIYTTFGLGLLVLIAAAALFFHGAEELQSE